MKGCAPGTGLTLALHALPINSPAQRLLTIRAKIIYNTGTYTVQTVERHDREAGDWVVITEADQDGYNGTFKVDTWIDRYNFTFTPVGTPATNSTGDVWLDKRSNQFIKITGIAQVGSTTEVDI